MATVRRGLGAGRPGLNRPAQTLLRRPPAAPALPPVPVTALQRSVDNWRGIEIREQAQKVAVWSLILMPLGLVLFFASLLSKDLFAAGAVIGMIPGGALFVAGGWMFLVAQVTHIRANTKR